MPEKIDAFSEFKKYMDDLEKNYIDFGNGLIIVFGEEKVNVRQYHVDGFCLSSWIDNNDFYTAINSEGEIK